MTKIYDPRKKDRFWQNVICLTTIYSSVIALFLYAAFCGMVVLVNGLPTLIRLFSLAPQLHVETVIATMKSYFLWWLANRKTIGLTGVNFFAVKFFAPFSFSILSLLTILIVFWDKIISFRVARKGSSLYGDAHWATQAEIKKAGMRAKKGVMMGLDKGGYLIADGYQHTLLFAPTGSGKGVGFVIPTMLFWTESVICHDIKLENYELTSGWRSKFLKQPVFVWEPSNPDGITHAYNPVDWVSKVPGKMIDDVQQFANLVLQKREFWENEARTFLCALLLIIIAKKDSIKSFGEVLRTMRSDDFIYDMAKELDTNGENIQPAGYMSMAAFLQKPDKERSGVMSTLSSGLELWINPYIDSATETSDFDVRTFRTIPTTVFVGLTPDNIQRLKPLMNMFYQQAFNFISSKMPSKTEKVGVLAMMDELPTLGKLEIVPVGIAYFRGYHLRMFNIVQDTQQLKGAYEEYGMNSLLTNSTYRITFAANNMETAELISKFCGNQTVESESYTKKKFFDGGGGGGGGSISSTQIPLLKPQDVIGLPKDEEIILVEASSPIRAKKIKYYNDKMFLKRLWEKIPLPQRQLRVPKNNRPSASSEDETSVEADYFGDNGNEQQSDNPTIAGMLNNNANFDQGDSEANYAILSDLQSQNQDEEQPKE